MIAPRRVYQGSQNPFTRENGDRDDIDRSA